MLTVAGIMVLVLAVMEVSAGAVLFPWPGNFVIERSDHPGPFWIVLSIQAVCGCPLLIVGFLNPFMDILLHRAGSFNV